MTTNCGTTIPPTRLTHDDVSWWNIPEQARCVCGHEKAVHMRVVPDGVGRSHKLCSASTLECACKGFHATESAMSWLSFADRFVGGGSTKPRLALGKALDFAGFDTGPRTWDEWLVRASRAWRAWQAAGRPIRAFGKDTYHGPVSIPALEGE